MKALVLLFLLVTSAFGHAQTKLIAHKSHSGSSQSFSKAYKNRLFDGAGSNFGLPENKRITVVDTILVVNDSTSVVKMREAMVSYFHQGGHKDLPPSVFERKSRVLVGNILIESALAPAQSVIRTDKNTERPIPFSNPVEEIVIIGIKEE